MNFHTSIPLKTQAFDQIDYHSKVLLLGSCFSENIADKFDYFKFQNLRIPFGILFHPLAIERFITTAINEKTYTDNDLFFHNEQWHCFEAHSRLSHASKDAVIENLNRYRKQTTQELETATHIIITLGTSWAYRDIASDQYVANCHKLPQKKFLKELLSITQISESLQSMISLVRHMNPKVTFIFTVSPVRHLKDGFIENTLSKSHLISSIHEVVDPRHHHYYFPSYEMMMDELRDYRFYKEDMIHPNTTAVNYIWKRFSEVWLSKGVEDTMNLVDEVQKGLAHRPFHPDSEAHQAFLQKLKDKQSLLESKFSHMTF
ncbi:GSCFA domain-containing protein [Psychroserpens sp. BH13MA-6]